VQCGAAADVILCFVLCAGCRLGQVPKGVRIITTWLLLVADDVHVLCTSVVLARPPAARRACRLSFLQELWQGSVVERHVVVLALSTCDWGGSDRVTMVTQK